MASRLTATEIDKKTCSEYAQSERKCLTYLRGDEMFGSFVAKAKIHPSRTSHHCRLFQTVSSTGYFSLCIYVKTAKVITQFYALRSADERQTK